MELRELRSFCVAARLRSVSKAAEQLGIGQPTVTTHIKKLEEELGLLLFDRVKRPIQPTAAGAALAQLATPLVEGIDDLALKTSAAEAEGPVSLAATPDIIPHSLIAVVKTYLSEHPHSQLRIRSAMVSEVLALLAQGEVDLGLVPSPVKSEDYDFEGLFAYERVLITPPNHPLLSQPLTSLEQIAEWPLILKRSGTYTRSMLESEFRRRGHSYEVIVELDSLDMTKRYVALGMGVSVGPRHSIEPEDYEKLGIVSLSNLLPIEQAGIVTLRGRTLSTPTLNLMQIMRKVLANSSISR